MLYVDGRKSLEGREENKFYICWVLGKNTRQTYNFTECWIETLGKLIILPSVFQNTRQSCIFANARHAVRRPSHMPVTWYDFAEC